MKKRLLHIILISIAIAGCIIAVSAAPAPTTQPHTQKSSESPKPAQAVPGKSSKSEKSAEPGKKEPVASAEEKQKKRDDERDRKNREWIERTLEFGIQRERIEAINKIMEIRNPSEKKELGLKLRNIIKEEIDSEVKTKALYVAGEIQLKELMPEISAGLDDETEDIRIASVYALKKINDASVALKMSEILKKQDLKKDTNFIEALINTLASFKAKDLKDFAVEHIKDVHTGVNNRQQLVLFLGRAGITESGDFLIERLKDDDEDTIIRAYACNSIASLDLKKAAPDIDGVIKTIESYPFKKRQNYHKLYMHGIAALAKMGDERAYPRLINSSRSNNDTVRIQAIRLLKDIKGERTIDILKHRMKYDPSPKVQSEARKALKDLGIAVEEPKEPAGDTGRKTRDRDKTPAKKSGKKTPPETEDESGDAPEE